MFWISSSVEKSLSQLLTRTTCTVLVESIVLMILWVYYTIPLGFTLFLALLGITFVLLNYIFWLRITDEGPLPEMRIWSILLFKSDLKYCIHLSRSLFFNSWSGPSIGQGQTWESPEDFSYPHFIKSQSSFSSAYVIIRLNESDNKQNQILVFCIFGTLCHTIGSDFASLVLSEKGINDLLLSIGRSHFPLRYKRRFQFPYYQLFVPEQQYSTFILLYIQLCAVCLCYTLVVLVTK